MSLRARFSSKGVVLPEPSLAETLEPLAVEGLYRVDAEFACCDNRCRTFPKGALVQLGYNGSGEPILFEPAWSDSGLSFPTRGQRIDAQKIESLSRLRVAEDGQQPSVKELH